MIFWGATAFGGRSAFRPVVKFEAETEEEAREYFNKLQEESDFSFTYLLRYRGYKRKNGTLCVQAILINKIQSEVNK